MMVFGFAGGAVWALVPGVLRAAGVVSETISTLLLNYIAPLIVSFSIFGPWRSAESASYPQSPAFVAAARLPSFLGTRVHLGLVFGLALLALYGFVLGRTRWGLAMRAIGGNAAASQRLGLPVPAYVIGVLGVAGGIAGLAGMEEVSAIQGRLVAELSPGYGYMGFLVAWLAGGNPLGILAMAFLVAVASSVGDILQITQGVPYAVVNLLLAVVLFIVLGQRGAAGGRR
jgi:simple sugar transport system permease protein